jgi:hypothetical protein
MNTKDVLIAIIDKLEAVANSAAALETAVKSNTLGGRQLTTRQLEELREKADLDLRTTFNDLRTAAKELNA